MPGMDIDTTDYIVKDYKIDFWDNLIINLYPNRSKITITIDKKFLSDILNYIETNDLESQLKVKYSRD